MICSLEASYIPQMDARDRLVYLPCIYRRDNDDPKTKAKLITLANARQYRSAAAALSASKTALRKLWRNLMSSKKADPSRKPTWREVLRIEPGSIEALSPHKRQEFARLAYLRRAQFCHPDAGGTHDLMAEINNAWDEAKKELGS